MEDNNNQVTRKCHQKGNNGFRTDRVFVRKFESADYPDVERIFIDGLMEMVPDTAFRGLKHHPESLLLYAAMTSKGEIDLISIYIYILTVITAKG